MKIFYTENDAALKRAMFEKIREDLAKIPGSFKRVILVVPRQSTFSLEEEALDALGGKGFFTLNVVSAEKLRGDIIRHTGGSGRVSVNAIGRSMVLRRAAGRLAPQLSVFSGISKDPGFVALLRDFIVQMKQGGVDAAGLLRLSEECAPGSLLSRKLSDMSLIASAYEEALSGRFLDSEDELAFVTSKIKDSSMIRDSKVYYYGFSSFSVLEAQFLSELDRCSCGVSIAMLCGEGLQFASARKALKMLGCGAEKLSVTYEKNDPSVEIVRCASTFTQAETLAARILRLVREDGLAYSDIAVLTPADPAAGKHIKRVLQSVDIPVFMDERRPVLHSSSAEAISALMALTDGRYMTGDIIRFARSGIIECDAETVWGLETYLKQYHIKGKRFLEPFKYRNKDITDEQFAAYEGLRDRLAEPISAFVQAFSEAKTAGSKADVLGSFLMNDLSLESRLAEEAAKLSEEGFADAAEETRQLCGIIEDMLIQIKELAGDEELENSEFAEMLLGALSDVKVGVLPQAEGRVQIGDIRRSVTALKKAVFITGFCDGLIPSSADAGGILTEAELSQLLQKGAEIAKGPADRISEEVYMVSRAVESAQDLLWIGIPQSGEGGEELKASPLLKDVKARFAKVSELRDIENGGSELDLLQGRAMPLERIPRVMREGLLGEPVGEVWKAAYNIIKDDAPQLKAGLLYSGREKALGKELAKELYGRGGELSLSPSRLDSFAACPFRHFIDYGLRPYVPREFGIDSIEIGDIYHEALLRLCAALSAPARKAGIEMTDPASLWMTVSRPETEAMVSDILSKMAEESLGGVMTSSKAEVFRSERVREVCARFAWHMIEQVRAGRIDSMFFEISFGRGQRLAPVVLETSVGKVYVEGKIDRVDRLPGPDGTFYTKIIDYKSGATSFNRKLIDEGLSLQLMTYLEGAVGESGDKPAGVYYFRISSDDVEAAASDIAAKELSEAVLDKIRSLYRLDGLTVSDDAVLSGLDRGIFAEGKSDVVNVKIKDGKKSGSIISAEEMEEFRGQFKERLLSAAERLAQGDITATRKTIKNVFDSCKYCGYSGICLRSVSEGQPV